MRVGEVLVAGVLGVLAPLVQYAAYGDSCVRFVLPSFGVGPRLRACFLLLTYPLYHLCVPY